MCGIYMSQYYIIPVIADTLSTYGLNQVIRKINDKAREIKRINDSYSIEPLGIVINRYRDNKPYTTIKAGLELKSNNGEIPKLFKTIIYNRSAISKVSHYDYSEKKNTIRGKYEGEFSEINKLAKEIIGRC